MSDKEKEKEEFISVLSCLISSLGRQCTVNDLKKAYREQQGHNINTKLDEVGDGNLYNFLRFECRSICTVWRNDGEFRILRVVNGSETEQSETKCQNNKKKAKNAHKAAPKLNFPKCGIINQYSFPRPNPQGFAKKNPFNQQKPQTNNNSTSPQFQTDFEAAYRPPQKLNFFIEDENDAEDGPHVPPTITFGSYAGAVTSVVEDDEKCDDTASVRSTSTPPKVNNPFDFPSLPTKSLKPGDSDSDNENMVENGSPDLSAASYQLSEIVQSPPAEAVQRPPAEAVQSPLAKIKHSLFANIKSPVPNVIQSPLTNIQSPPTIFVQPPQENKYPIIDEIINRWRYSAIITDPSFVIREPRLVAVQEKVMFAVYLTMVYSPWCFYFCIDDLSSEMLMKRLFEFYESQPADELLIEKENLKPGLVVAAKICNAWYRVVVVKEPEADGGVRVFQVDFGPTCTVHISQIRFLMQSFGQEPAKSLCGSMAGVTPKHYDEWDLPTRQAFFNIVSDKKLYASIRNRQPGVYEIELSRFPSPHMHTLADEMVTHGLVNAEIIPNTLPYAIPSVFG